MKNKDEVIKYNKVFSKFKKGIPKYPFKKEIDRMLCEMPLKKIRKAKKLWKNSCRCIFKKVIRNEQMYRSLYGSMKIKLSYYAFVDAALIILYLYGHISDEEFENPSVELLDKYKDIILEIRDVYDRLKREEYLGDIPTVVMMMTFGAGQVFCFAAKSIIQVVERAHKEKEYRERLYYGGFLDWDEAMLLKALVYEYYKKNSRWNTKN